jgi:predicted RNA-binding Zn ribbon-like protein
MPASPAIFVADALAVDFLNSIATPVDTPVDWIDEGEGFLDWLSQAGLVPAEALERLREEAMPGELDNVAAQARSLREWFRAFVERRRGRSLTAEDLQDLEPLNRLLARGEAFDRIAPRPHGDKPFVLQSSRRWRSPETLLQPIGETLARFVCEEDLADVKACEGPACTLMFVDHTRGRVRRWCSMSICGNRAKQAAYRGRAKSQARMA